MTLKLHASLRWNDSLIDRLTERISSSDYILRINWSSESFVDRKCHICLFSFVLFDCEQHIFRFWIKKDHLNMLQTKFKPSDNFWRCDWVNLACIRFPYAYFDLGFILEAPKRDNYNLVRQFLTWTLGGSKASHAQGELDPPAGEEPTKAQLIRATCAELVAADKAPPGASFICIDLQQ